MTHSRRDAAAVRAATSSDVSCRRCANRSDAKAAESGRGGHGVVDRGLAASTLDGFAARPETLETVAEPTARLTSSTRRTAHGQERNLGTIRSRTDSAIRRRAKRRLDADRLALRRRDAGSGCAPSLEPEQNATMCSRAEPRSAEIDGRQEPGAAAECTRAEVARDWTGGDRSPRRLDGQAVEGETPSLTGRCRGALRSRRRYEWSAWPVERQKAVAAGGSSVDAATDPRLTRDRSKTSHPREPNARVERAIFRFEGCTVSAKAAESWTHPHGAGRGHEPGDGI